MSAAQATSSDRLYYCTNTMTQRGGTVKPNGSGLTVSRSLIPAVGHLGHASHRKPGQRWLANSTRRSGAGQARPMHMASYRRPLRTLRTAAASLRVGVGRRLAQLAVLSCPRLSSLLRAAGGRETSSRIVRPAPGPRGRLGSGRAPIALGAGRTWFLPAPNHALEHDQINLVLFSQFGSNAPSAARAA